MTPLALTTPLPALVVGTVQHTRIRPLRHAFTHHSYTWLVDLDAPPRLPRWLAPFAKIRGEDHLAGEPGLDRLKANVLRVLGREQPEHEATRVVMLANARILGHVFDPLTVYWCLTPADALVGVVLEVHNTYGERHAYVLPPGAERGRVSKAFYVSPFNDTSGEYDVRVRLSPTRVSAAVTLNDDLGEVLSAATVGTPVPATPGQLVRQLARLPLVTVKITALIRLHGIWLWLRRLPVRPRPQHDPWTVR